MRSFALNSILEFKTEREEELKGTHDECTFSVSDSRSLAVGKFDDANSHQPQLSFCLVLYSKR